MGGIEGRGLAEQTNDLLLEWIVNARFKPGERLIEGALADELGVSRTPVREALRSLAANGFVTLIPRRGIFVSQIDIRRLEDVLEIRHLLEMYAAERSVERISQKDLKEMRSLVKECEPLVGGSDRRGYNRYVEKDCDLHRLIIRTGGNSLLAELYERLAVFLQIARVRLIQLMPSMTRGHEEHEAIVAAYEARDKDRLLQLLASHLRRSTDEVLWTARRKEGEKGSGSSTSPMS